MLTIIELTVPLETNVIKAHSFKCDKYASLVNDIEENGIKVSLLCIEIGARGYISSDNQKRIKCLLNMCKGVRYKEFRNNLSKLASLGSFVIYHAKEDPAWINPPLLKISL